MKRFPIRRFLFVALFSVASLSAAAGSMASTASELSVDGAVMISGAPVEVLSGVTEVVVVGASQGAEGISLILRGGVEASAFTTEILLTGTGASLVATGEVLEVATSALGLGLYHAGKLVALIPNAIGHELIHHQTYR